MCGIGLIASGLRLTGPLVPEGTEEVDGSRPPTLVGPPSDVCLNFLRASASAG